MRITHATLEAARASRDYLTPDRRTSEQRTCSRSVLDPVSPATRAEVIMPHNGKVAWQDR